NANERDDKNGSIGQISNLIQKIAPSCFGAFKDNLARISSWSGEVNVPNVDSEYISANQLRYY
ncbi:hypothetical protein, partial [Vibrio rotiferianus]|uniref:hypothetical protein n=1 Tax=Vibrio rotiferianus TaxID=190895 RepID=UPI000C381FDF